MICGRGFPKEFSDVTVIGEDGFAQIRRPNDGRKFLKIIDGVEYTFDNRHVVAYSPWLTLRYGCHTNVEMCSTIQCVKYMYKYVYKGGDRTLVKIVSSNDKDKDDDEQHDEITEYLQGRYLTAPEAVANIFSFHLHDQYPSVMILDVHLSDQQFVQYQAEDKLKEVAKKKPISTLMGWFKANKDYPEYRHLLYADYPEHFTWCRNAHMWKPRSEGTRRTIGRMYTAYPKHGERFYLRLLLNHVTGAQSFGELRTVDNVMYENNKTAAEAAGLTLNDNEYRECLAEAKEIQSGFQLRALFAVMLLHCNVVEPFQLFNDFFFWLAEDIFYQCKQVIKDLTIDDKRIETEVLHQIEDMMISQNKTLRDIDDMPWLTTRHTEIYDILTHHGVPILPPVNEDELKKQIGTFNSLQWQHFNLLSGLLLSNKGGLYHIDATGGTGIFKNYNYISNI